MKTLTGSSVASLFVYTSMLLSNRTVPTSRPISTRDAFPDISFYFQSIQSSGVLSSLTRILFLTKKTFFRISWLFLHLYIIKIHIPFTYLNKYTNYSLLLYPLCSFLQRRISQQGVRKGVSSVEQAVTERQ